MYYSLTNLGYLIFMLSVSLQISAQSNSGLNQFSSEGQWRPGMVHCNGTPTEIVEVRNPITGRVWMDRNLGASRAATSSTDEAAYGDLYQWGRFGDGHQCRNSATTTTTTTTLSSSNTPGHGKFIRVSYNYDWRSPQNDNLWQGVNGMNNPCPMGFRLPTDSEWEIERKSWSNNSSSGAMQSALKLPLGGFRNHIDGSLISFTVGSVGFFWSAAVSGASSRYIFFDSSKARLGSNLRGFGFSVRCLQD
jgi:uncharacterized protein (TIGR02145 family)